jgi:hypothetical protein
MLLENRQGVSRWSTRLLGSETLKLGGEAPEIDRAEALDLETRVGSGTCGRVGEGGEPDHTTWPR